MEIPNLTETGGSKYGVQQGYGCIWRRYPLYIFVLSFLGLCGYQRPRKKTIHHVSSYFIMSHLFKSSNQVEILNLAETGGSKYGVPQGYGCIWRKYPFYMFVLYFLVYADIKDHEKKQQFIMSHHISSCLI